MRILIKGGVWKNTEDEILKAAVMKYGKNQWARVASLLNRKSSKQCKARWYEWLDPSIKKTEWNRDEEEKLLHLAKLMPNQWRTIAPIVGRTAAQCMEQYEKLLDMAQEKQEAEAGDGEDDPRRLRAGEIDPTPETKPARPDPIDMDEDEKEMLSEARARLANTKGKKAKRKARERQLEESRRLSMLQKRRELKAAGIESKLGSGGKRKFIDYAREIPFQKLAPSGFFDVSEESSRSKSLKLNPVAMGMELQKMEGKHEREEEERERAKDKKRLKTLFKANAPLAIKLIEEQNDPSAVRRRSVLSLPAPQVSDTELEEIVKVGQSNLLMGPPDGSLSSQSLVGDYSSVYRPTPTPLRTPVQEDIIMQEARNQRVLRDMTPLLGKDLPELYEGTGFEGATPRSAKLATPNTLISGTPLSQGMTPGSKTPSTVSVSSRTPSLQIRDHFGLNEAHSDVDTFSVSEFASVSSRAEKLREKQMKAQLVAKLKGLPEPEYSYDISIPAIAVDEGDSAPARVEDAADIEERQRQLLLANERDEMARRSSVLRKGLPRPHCFSQDILSAPSPHIANDPALLLASSLVNQEANRLIMRDNVVFPDMSLPPATFVEELDHIDDNLLQLAREAVADEYKHGKGMLYSLCWCLVLTCLHLNSGEGVQLNVFEKEWFSTFERFKFVPNPSGGGGKFKIPQNDKEVKLLIVPWSLYAFISLRLTLAMCS
jgi:pre-mRNA-splicing factor CDC5/CEF1